MVTLRTIVNRFRRGYIALQKRRSKGIPQGSNIVLNAQFPYPFPYPYPPKEKKEEEKEIPGIDLSEKVFRIGSEAITSEVNREMLQQINYTYNLIPRFPKKGEKVFAYAHIAWDSKRGELIYNVVEPKISQFDKEIIESTKRELEERLDVDFYRIGVVKAKKLLRDHIVEVISEHPGVDMEKREILVYYIERDIIGLGKIEPLMNDPNIEDISCDGVNIPIYVYHRDPKIGSIKTNVVFTDESELNRFVVQLAQKCRKTINIAEPLLDATLPDGSRVQLTLGTDIARKGSNFTIRKFTELPLTPTHMIRFGTMNALQMAYLWLAVENGQSILISGGTATGKTSMLNALSLFIRPSLKIVSIEDTAELRLPHPHWIPEVARSALSETEKRGEVTLFDLLKSSLRQRPDYIVMGEVRGKEAFVLFQQMATGHPSIATMHAASVEQLVDRLTTPPISLPPTLLENINIIIFLIMTRHRGKYVRRANNIMEVVGIKDRKPLTRNVFMWDSSLDKFKPVDKSFVLKNIATRLGLDDDKIREELARRKIILEWMLFEEILDYREFAKVISTYYSNPEVIMKFIREKYGFLTPK